METGENVVWEGSSVTSIQHETKIGTSNDEIAVPNNLLNNLVENLEEFEERMNFDIEQVYKKFEEKIVTQSKLIESLRARIEYLEIDSVAKDEDIKKLRHEIHETIIIAKTKNTMNENELNVQFTEPLNVESHYNIQNKSETTIECKKCGKKFQDYAKYHKHNKENHNKYKCIVCQQAFPTKKGRKRHMRKNHKKDFPCNLCKKKFYLIAGLREHFRAKHSGGKFFPKAPRASHPPSTSVTSPLAVVEFIHEILPYQLPTNKMPPYQLRCKICKEIFDTHSKFNTHAKSLHDCKFACPDCSQVFLSKGLRKSHVKKSYRCQVCNKSVISEGGLISHCRQKHGQMSIVDIYYAAMGIQLSTSQSLFSEQEIILNELEITHEGGDNGSFDNDHTDEESNDDDYAEEEENERSDDTEDENDYTEEENGRSDYDDTEDENEKSDDNDRGF
ncbi:hypothetical protein RhiirA1_406577 [Rhizophagus irregularis]|uniref:C2H2-type domain-containing protein n=1 Tax=Rhizophagus irregularis TaxID=588596 RepID=A0A2I1DRG7_9GLOM|nr:hypothetical protein RhiirA1_406577 [Rhizophagus irregularis]PKY12472.1 hypothetical protein RhiirB3_397485 [Rhizophagus irregularis]CAB4491991.1 unnamed protein product [Rhizophagus irregularis]CAB5392332.1 unnamed protein product [Rhizophagus irregularis]